MDSTPAFHEYSNSLSVSSGAVFVSTPNTTARNRKSYDSKLDSVLEATPSCPKFSSTLNESAVESSTPLKESLSLLYPYRPVRKPSPRNIVSKINTPVKKRLFSKSTAESFNKVLQNQVIMHLIFRYLSNGNLYRLSQVSRSFCKAIKDDSSASERLQNFRLVYKVDKENYKITPPSSPEKPVEKPKVTRNFLNFYTVGQCLQSHQHLQKCPKCLNPSIIDSNIGQCQSSICGYIYCTKCSSFSCKPADFVDKCNSSRLLTSQSPRQHFCELSNTAQNFINMNLNDSSGFVSGGDESKQTPSVVQAASRKMFGRNFNRASGATRKRKIEPIKAIRMVPVVPIERVVKEEESPCTPPKQSSYAICTKQNKKNLRRLLL